MTVAGSERRRAAVSGAAGPVGGARAAEVLQRRCEGHTEGLLEHPRQQGHAQGLRGTSEHDWRMRLELRNAALSELSLALPDAGASTVPSFVGG